ncbi:type II toxin-antitoxin system VapC family toxin [Inquilinus limosus]|uniref:Ribonuclease VapC n=1 Tax=Inquilinus limosus TaxID=171674 RepID=A0A211ZTD2_9PROT|nr:type II toxin-antitoxin system VapC family toxin [Inquilinus limosus]OWJ68552.1 VapC toxin family PIN domain ribonuclease [Inquilinus limosus]
MILLDTSVWVDHLRAGDEGVAALLDSGRVLSHPFVIGELALGHLRQRKTIIPALQNLPQASIATDAEVLLFIERNALAGLGIGYVDVHLLAATRLTAGSALWTRDKRLAGIAERLSLGWDEGKAGPK